MKSHGESSHQESGASPRHELGHAGRRWRVLRRRTLGTGIGLIIPVVGLGVAACGSSSSTQTATTAAKAASGSGGFGGAGGSNARSTNAAGGALGTVTAVSSAGFTVSPPKGGTVTVKETSSTVYEQGTQRATASAVTKGTEVLVFGKVNSTTITATEVVAKPGINLKTASANVLGFQQGEAGNSKTVGQIPKDYTQGSGTLVSGSKANQAIEAALTAYAGGVIDRVVQLSNGDFEVHHIGVNWPHHIFVNKDFKVIGAGD
jgi:hypothetical protein